MAFLFIMVGVSGSGKSTYAEKIKNKLLQEGSNAIIISSDNIRAEICSGNVQDQSKNAQVFKIAYERLNEAMILGSNVIFDATSLCRETRKIPVEIGRRHNATIIAIVMCTPLTVSIERNRSRERVVPTPVIWKQQGRFFPPTLQEVDQVVNVGLDTEWPHWTTHKIDNK